MKKIIDMITIYFKIILRAEKLNIKCKRKKKEKIAIKNLKK